MKHASHLQKKKNVKEKTHEIRLEPQTIGRSHTGNVFKVPVKKYDKENRKRECILYNNIHRGELMDFS